MDKKMFLSRRKFFKGAGGMGAAALLSSAVTTLASVTTAEAATPDMSENVKAIPPVRPPAKWDHEADVVVIGTGCSGAAATVSALEHGAKVITIEKTAIWGGHSQYSMIFAGTGEDPKKVMDPNNNLYMTAFHTRARNVLLDSIIAKRMYGSDGELVPSGPNDNDSTIKWLVNMGVKHTDQFTLIPNKLLLAPIDPDFKPAEPTEFEKSISAMLNNMYGSTQAMTQNWYSWFPYNARAYPYATQKRAMELGAKVMYSAKVVALVKSGDAIVGVKVQKEDGTVIFIKAPSVVLCTGGYMANRDMIKHYWDARRVQDINRYCGLSSATGDGIRMAQGLGAAVNSLDEEGEIWDGGAQDPTLPNGPRSFYSAANQLSRQATLTVNKSGKRFFNESAVLGTEFFYRAKQKNSQQDATCFTIFDSTMITPEAIVEKFFPILCEFPCPWFKKDFKRQLAAGIIQKADTIGELANLMGVDIATFGNTVKRYNGFCAATDAANGVTGDTDFYKSANSMFPIEKPPFYFVKGVGGSIISTHGGLEVDADSMQVVTTERKPINGLYAAGELLAFEAGVAAGTTSGRYAGELAAKKALGQV